jgi:hypothetical protein
MICLIHLKKHVPSLFLFADSMYSLSISISSGKIHINFIRRFIKHLHPGFKQSSIKISFQKLESAFYLRIMYIKGSLVYNIKTFMQSGANQDKQTCGIVHEIKRKRSI